MKLTPAITLLALATPLLAQTATKSATTTHRTTTTHRPATSGACADLPTLDAKIPKIPGCPKTLYALKYIDTVIGTGELAQPMKLYTVHYSGYLLDGTKFDSSVDRKEPIVFPAGFHRVITGWDTGFQGMHVGGKRRLFIPYELAYGEAGKPPTIPAKSMLVFDVELISEADLPQQPPQQQRPATPPTPPPAGTPPAGSTPPPPAGAIPTPPPASTPGSAPKTSDPTKPATVPPPTDPTKPTTTPSPTKPAQL